jgi:hypothetical protein
MTAARRTAAILAASHLSVLLSGQALAPDVLALSHASILVRQTVAALSNCVCLESVTRSTLDKKGKATQKDGDSLQIQVTTIGDREWFSWPGREDTFVDNPAALVDYGLMDTGEFTSTLKTVFLDGFAVRHFHGATTFRARPALQFDYSVSSVFTHFRLKSHGASVTAGMKGSFWIDPQTSELLALSSDAAEIPPGFAIRSASSEVIYAPMYLNDHRVVMPQTASTVVHDLAGPVRSNHLEFSHCHSYSSASSVVFNDAKASPAAPDVSPPRVSKDQEPIPGRLSFLLRLRTPLTDHTLIGERFSATMDSDIRSHGKTIVQKGAEVSGRVRWLQATTCPSPCLAVAIELLTVMGADGATHPVYASLSRVEPESRVRIDVTSVSQTEETLPFGGQKLQSSSQSIRIPEIPGVGSFFVVAPDLTTPPGMLMTWITQSPRR